MLCDVASYQPPTCCCLAAQKKTAIDFRLVISTLRGKHDIRNGWLSCRSWRPVFFPPFIAGKGCFFLGGEFIYGVFGVFLNTKDGMLVNLKVELLVAQKNPLGFPTIFTTRTAKPYNPLHKGHAVKSRWRQKWEK